MPRGEAELLIERDVITYHRDRKVGSIRLAFDTRLLEIEKELTELRRHAYKDIPRHLRILRS